ncbi:hypothetical protein ACFRAR_15885 [Kitasatospora sp. NPDC056651]|uniref:hypothetical protein n=1 Tax=Kitasatospora sp. NPDC056651 TaxID=3345892 RepID=UPI00369B6CAE
MADLVPTACAALRRRSGEVGAPATYWFFGDVVRIVAQCEPGGRCPTPGAPIWSWTNQDGQSYPFPADATSYGTLWRSLAGALGPGGPQALYTTADRTLLHAILRGEWPDDPVRVASFDPEAEGLMNPEQPWEPHELTRSGVSASMLSAACAVDLSPAVLLFGQVDSGPVHWRWDPHLKEVSGPSPLPAGVKGPVTAAFLGYDTAEVDHGASKVSRRITRLYSGAEEQAFVVTESATGFAFHEVPSAAPFLKQLTEHVKQP